ncbi:MAG: endonuclease/exonuclease/phosphatase family protein [Clostridia bacterium]|nr:endonuclease/exonuclease/phosphatase family protein [Clostridia bacterium]
MKLMSFNTQHCLNYLEQKIDFNIMARTIKECDAHIVGLNEMRSFCESDSEYADQTAILSSLTGMQYYYFAEAIRFYGTKPYGNGMLSKLPIISAETVIIPDPDPKKYNGYYETRCILKAKLQGDITVLIVHMGLNPDEQENAVKTVIENLADSRCILMGDFNMKPDNPLLKPIKERMIDTADYFGEPKLSFPSDKPNRKIDYIFVSPDVEIISADIPAIVSADHRPHTAEVIMK